MTVERPTPAERPDRAHPAAAPKKKKLGKRTTKFLAGIASAIALVLPWAVIRAVPRPAVTAGAQLVAVPAGSHVVIKQAPTGGAASVVVTAGKGGGGVTAAPVTTTGGSAPPPPGA